MNRRKRWEGRGKDSRLRDGFLRSRQHHMQPLARAMNTRSGEAKVHNRIV